MNISPIKNYFQVKKNNQQKHATNNINFGMAKLDQVQFSKSKDDYFRQAREDYIGHFWTSHPEDEVYIPKIGSAEADKKYFIDKCPPEEMKEVLSAEKYGINKDQNFYQALNLDGYKNLADKDKHLILDEIYDLPDLKEGEQRKTFLSELAAADIKEFWKCLNYGFTNYTTQEKEKVLKADTYLWDTLDDENKCGILYRVTKETRLKLIAQEMEKLPEAKPDENQSSIFTHYDYEEFLSLIEDVEKKTLISWMKKDNVFIKKLNVYGVMRLVEKIGVEEFDKLYSKKYGELFDSFFDDPNAKKQAIKCYGVDRYKRYYEEKYDDWEKIEYDSYLYNAKKEGCRLDVLPLKISDFQKLKPEYQADFIIRILNREINIYCGLDRKLDDNKMQNFVEDYAINNENVSIEDSIKILECLLKIYSKRMKYYKEDGEYENKDRINHYQDKIINIQIALQELKAQIQ